MTTTAQIKITRNGKPALPNSSMSFEEKLNETLSSASYKADDILLAMEEKLEVLRKQNAKLQMNTKVDQLKTEVKKATV